MNARQLMQEDATKSNQVWMQRQQSGKLKTEADDIGHIAASTAASRRFKGEHRPKADENSEAHNLWLERQHSGRLSTKAKQVGHAGKSTAASKSRSSDHSKPNNKNAISEAHDVWVRRQKSGHLHTIAHTGLHDHHTKVNYEKKPRERERIDKHTTGAYGLGERRNRAKELPDDGLDDPAEKARLFRKQAKAKKLAVRKARQGERERKKEERKKENEREKSRKALLKEARREEKNAERQAKKEERAKKVELKMSRKALLKEARREKRNAERQAKKEEEEWKREERAKKGELGYGWIQEKRGFWKSWKRRYFMFDTTSQTEPFLVYLANKGKKVTPKGKISLVGANVSADSADHRNLVLIIHTSDEEKNRIRVAPVPRQKSRGVERDRWINCIHEVTCSADLSSQEFVPLTETEKRVQREGGRVADDTTVCFCMQWEDDVDLDLHCEFKDKQGRVQSCFYQQKHPASYIKLVKFHLSCLLRIFESILST